MKTIYLTITLLTVFHYGSLAQNNRIKSIGDYYIVEKDDKLGLLNNEDEIVIDIQYDAIEKLGEQWDFENNPDNRTNTYYWVREGEKEGIFTLFVRTNVTEDKQEFEWILKPDKYDDIKLISTSPAV
jgi:hypothetical protein